MKTSATLEPTIHSSAIRPVDMRMVLWMVLLTLLWGLNAITIKTVTEGITPIMSAGLRGVLALTLMTAWGLWRGERLVYRGRELLHGGVIGLMFGVEFILIYSGALYTNGGHISIFINTAPFFVALGAHFILQNDRLHVVKIAGLLLAFCGIILLFSDQLYVSKSGFWRGDLLVMGGAILWAGTTLYMKRYMVTHWNGFRLLHVQVLVSTPILVGYSLLTESNPLFAVSTSIVVTLVFQAGVIVFFSYLMWMILLRVYPASSMQSFTFLSPIWGVLAGIILLGEKVSLFLMIGMALVGLGLFLVNRTRSG